MSTPLRHNDCKNQCNWVPTGRLHDELPLFICTGCSSEWVRSQSWTPRNADGKISPEVQAERDLADTQA